MALENLLPTNSINCVDDCKHSPVKGRYILTPEQAAEIKEHPKVQYIHPDFSRYWGTYKPPTHEIICAAKYNRYNSNRRQYRDMQVSMPYTLLMQKQDVLGISCLDVCKLMTLGGVNLEHIKQRMMLF